MTKFGHDDDRRAHQGRTMDVLGERVIEDGAAALFAGFGVLLRADGGQLI